MLENNSEAEVTFLEEALQISANIEVKPVAVSACWSAISISR
ncbi:hypothetical protein C900_05485 [Fulvivirga imtechensis AK7]|uniref:Uncharacterized protein n=1 Tax=Fulvivirga imtechensis AK7 TaxID=1237149 RepID=L8JJL1_9BACT|nr:hypothetical protein C900_05485 [Fulvivirga imtechensis AK7]